MCAKIHLGLAAAFRIVGLWDEWEHHMQCVRQLRVAALEDL